MKYDLPIIYMEVPFLENSACIKTMLKNILCSYVEQT